MHEYDFIYLHCFPESPPANILFFSLQTKDMTKWEFVLTKIIPHFPFTKNDELQQRLGTKCQDEIYKIAPKSEIIYFFQTSTLF